MTNFTPRIIDRFLRFDTSVDSVTVTLLPFARTPNATFEFHRTDAPGNANFVTIKAATGDFLLPDGTTSVTLDDTNAGVVIKIPETGESPAMVMLGGTGGTGSSSIHGTVDYFPVFTGPTTLADSQMFQVNDPTKGYSVHLASPTNNMLQVGPQAALLDPGNSGFATFANNLYATDTTHWFYIENNPASAIVQNVDGDIVFYTVAPGTANAPANLPNSTRMILTNEGRVGIGTNPDPTSLLHLSDTADYTELLVENKGTGQPMLGLKNPNRAWSISVNADDNGVHIFDGGGAGGAGSGDRMVIATNGGVGIGAGFGGASMPLNRLDLAFSGGVGGMHIASGQPANTGDALYQISDVLYWNGQRVLTAGTVGTGVTSLNTLQGDLTIVGSRGVDVTIGSGATGSNIYIDTPQDLRTTANPQFESVIVQRLQGATQVQQPDDSIYFGTATEKNFFIDRDVAGGQFVFGYETPNTTASSDVFQIYNNKTDQTLLFRATTAGTSGGVSFADLLYNAQVKRAGTIQTTSMLLSLKLAERISLADFGITGSSYPSPVDETAKLQNALNTIARGNWRGVLYVPGGMTVFITSVTVPSGVKIIGDGPELCGFYRYDLSTTNAMFVLAPGTTDVALMNFTIEGRIGDNVANALRGTTRMLNNYDQELYPNTVYSNYSSVFVDYGCRNMFLHGLWFTHSGGQSILCYDAFGINSSGITVDNCRFANCRPAVKQNPAGTGRLSGSWGGGLLFFFNGSDACFHDVVISNNEFINCTGNCVWFHAQNVSNMAFLSRNVYQYDNYAENVALDYTQPTSIDGYVETGNEVVRFGFMTLRDDASDLAACWGDGPVAFDTAGVLINFIRSGNEAMGNGEMYDLDGAGFGTISNSVFISSFVSKDPLVGPTSNMGPDTALGQNWTRFVNTGNTFNFSPLIGTYLIMTGNEIYGAGGGAFSCFGMQHSRISDNLIDIPGDIRQTPVSIGNYPYQHSTDNDIVSNSFRVNSGSAAGPCIAEVNSAQAWASGTTYSNGQLVNYSGNVWASLQGGNVGHPPSSSPAWWYAAYPYAPFTTADCNHVMQNTVVALGSNAMYHFAKDPSSGSGDMVTVPYFTIPTRSAQAVGIVETQIITTGTNNASVQTQIWINAAPNTVIDQYNQVVGATPVGSQALTLTPTAAFVPALGIGSGGIIDSARNIGPCNSLTINKSVPNGVGPVIAMINPGGSGSDLIDFYTFANQSLPTCRYEVRDVGPWTGDHIFHCAPPGAGLPSAGPLNEIFRISYEGKIGINVGSHTIGDMISNYTGNILDQAGTGNTGGHGITITANNGGYVAVFNNNNGAGLLCKSQSSTARVLCCTVGTTDVLVVTSTGVTITGNLAAANFTPNSLTIGAGGMTNNGGSTFNALATFNAGINASNVTCGGINSSGGISAPGFNPTGGYVGVTGYIWVNGTQLAFTGGRPGPGTSWVQVVGGIVVASGTGP